MDLFSLTGKVGLVTGGTGGLGLMIARGLLQAGATRVYVTSREEGEPDAVLDELSRYGEVVHIAGDLRREEDCAALVASVSDRESRLDILVNNAGTAWHAPLESFPVVGWDRVVDLNLKAPFLLTQGFTDLLEAAGTPDDPARIINIGSIEGLRVSEIETYSYAATKAGLHHLTKVLARKLGSQAITVNAIAPGPFATELLAEAPSDWAQSLTAGAALPRFGRPDDIVGASVFLTSRAGAWITGAVLPVDGGIWAAT